MLGLQRALGGTEPLRLGGQRCGLDLLLLMRCGQRLLSQLQLALELLLLLFEGRFNLFDTRIGLFLKLLCQLRDQLGQCIAQCRRALKRRRLLAFQLFQVTMNGGFRARIAQFDTYSIDAGVLAPGYQHLPCLLHYRLVYAAPGHDCSYYFVSWYVPCIYV
ncbi:hypothetical protein D3C75_978580 [compost metagenome]